MLFITALCIYFVSNAQTSVWKVENQGSEFYLCGTSHVLRDQDLPLPAEFDLAYRASQKIVLEADVSKIKDPTIAQSMLSKSMLTDGKTLKTVLSETTYNKLSEECAKLGLPMQSLSMLKPSMLSITILGMKMLQLGLKNEGVDLFYYKKGIEDKKEISFLESVDLQIDLLTSGSDGIEEEFTSLFLHDLQNLEKEINLTIDSWKSGDAKFLNQKIKEIMKASPKYYHSLLKDRNDAWMGKLDVYLADKEVEMVLVGALHLYGKDGLLQQLKTKGYAISQVMNP